MIVDENGVFEILVCTSSGCKVCNKFRLCGHAERREMRDRLARIVRGSSSEEKQCGDMAVYFTNQLNISLAVHSSPGLEEKVYQLPSVDRGMVACD